MVECDQNCASCGQDCAERSLLEAPHPQSKIKNSCPAFLICKAAVFSH